MKCLDVGQHFLKIPPVDVALVLPFKGLRIERVLAADQMLRTDCKIKRPLLQEIPVPLCHLFLHAEFNACEQFDPVLVFFLQFTYFGKILRLVKIEGLFIREVIVDVIREAEVRKAGLDGFFNDVLHLRFRIGGISAVNVDISSQMIVPPPAI